MESSAAVPLLSIIFFYLFYFPNTRKLEEKETCVKNPGEVKVFLTWTDQRDV